MQFLGTVMATFPVCEWKLTVQAAVLWAVTPCHCRPSCCHHVQDGSLHQHANMKRKCEMQEPRNHVTLFMATLLFWWKMEKWKKKFIVYLRSQYMRSVNKMQPYPTIGGAWWKQWLPADEECEVRGHIYIYIYIFVWGHRRSRFTTGEVSSSQK